MSLKDKLSKPLSEGIPIPSGLAIIFVLLLIVGIGYIIGFNEVDYWRTTAGISLLIVLGVAFAIYIVLVATKSIQFNNTWTALATILLIFLGIFIFIGVLPSLQKIAITLIPYVLLFGIGYLIYTFGKKLEPESRIYLSVGIIVMIVAVPMFHIFVAPSFVGEPAEIEIVVSVDNNGLVDIDPYFYFSSIVRTTTYTFNPYAIALTEASKYMWYSAGEMNKYYVDIKVDDMYQDKIIYEEHNKEIYLNNGQSDTIWGAFRLDTYEIDEYKYRLVVDIYDANHDHIKMRSILLTN